MERLTRQGRVQAVGKGQKRAYTVVPNAGPPDLRWATSVDTTPEQDRRFAPRLRGVAVDVEAELIRIFERAGEPLSVDEVVEAWGSLRADGKRKRGSAAADMRAIIEAKRKRAARAARRTRTMEMLRA